MRTYLIAALAALLLVAPATASAADRANCSHSTERAYSKAFNKVERTLGHRAQGRDIRHRGVKFMGRSFDPTCHDLRRTTRQLNDLLTPRNYLRVEPVAPRQPPAGVKSRIWVAVGLASCIVFYESGGDPTASNGNHFGIAQWTYEAWARHGGVRMWGVTDPRSASYQQQLEVLDRGLSVYGCRDWCPFDPC